MLRLWYHAEAKAVRARSISSGGGTRSTRWSPGSIRPRRATRRSAACPAAIASSVTVLLGVPRAGRHQAGSGPRARIRPGQVHRLRDLLRPVPVRCDHDDPGAVATAAPTCRSVSRVATRERRHDESVKTLDGNEAAASIAYRTNEICAIYPITPPSSTMSWRTSGRREGKTNIWGTVPHVVEMQSEGAPQGRCTARCRPAPRRPPRSRPPRACC